MPIRPVLKNVSFVDAAPEKCGSAHSVRQQSEIIEKAAPVPDNSAQNYSDVPVYYEPFSYAKENDEVDLSRPVTMALTIPYIIRTSRNGMAASLKRTEISLCRRL